MMKADADERSEYVFAARNGCAHARGAFANRSAFRARPRTIKDSSEQTEQNGDFLA
jgi:hypothetical protein